MAKGANDSATSNASWTSAQAYVMAIICLLVGMAVGYFIRGSAQPSSTQTSATGAPSGGAPAMPGTTGMQQPTPEQLKHMADTQAAPLIEKLKATPNDAVLLANVGNLYYDAPQYNDAID